VYCSFHFPPKCKFVILMTPFSLQRPPTGGCWYAAHDCFSDWCKRLHDQHGTDDTDGGKTGSLHAHASGAALGCLAVAASSVGRGGACVAGFGRACGAGGGEDGSVAGGVDAVASGARGCARDAGCESRGAGDGHGRVGVGGVAGVGGEAAACGGGLGARLGGAGGGGGVGCGRVVSVERCGCAANCAIFKHTDGLAGVLADFLEVLGGGVLVVAAVLGNVAGDLGRVVGADRLDVGRVRALAVDCQFCGPRIEGVCGAHLT
jgi:hypothetical protein